MQLSIESSVVQEALKVLTRLAPPTSGTVLIISDGKGATMQSASDVDRCSFTLPCKVKGKENMFAIQIEALRDATKARKDLEMTYDSNLLVIKSGSYVTKLATADAMQNEYDEEKKIAKIKVSAEQAQWLKDAVASVALKPTAILSAYMPLTIKLTKKGAFVACYDARHMAFLESKEIDGDMEVTLPLHTVQSVLEVFGGSKFTMELTNSNLYVSNPLINVVLALQQTETEEITADIVREKAKASSKMDGNLIEVSKKDITDFLENARAVLTKERGEIHIQTEKGVLRLASVTVNGSTRVKIKADVKKSIDVKIDYEYFDEAVRKCDDKMSMKVVGDDFIMFKQKKASVLVALNQDTAVQEEKPKKKKKSEEDDE